MRGISSVLGLAVGLRARLVSLWILSLTWEPKSVEILLGVLTLTRAWMLLPWDSYALSPSLYELMRVIPQERWGAVALVLGVFSVGVAVSDAHDAARSLRWALAALSCAHWAIISILFWISNPHSIAGLDRSVIAFGTLWVSVNLFSQGAVLRTRAKAAAEAVAKEGAR